MEHSLCGNIDLLFEATLDVVNDALCFIRKGIGHGDKLRTLNIQGLRNRACSPSSATNEGYLDFTFTLDLRISSNRQ